jgi:hypothetical protein
MSHVTCPKCSSNEHVVGYGFAAGPLGSYTFCCGCDELIEFAPDTEGLDDMETAMADQWGGKILEAEPDSGQIVEAAGVS